MLPRFLIADNSQELPDSIFVVHTQSPRFIVGSDVDDFNTNQEIFWIDEKPADQEAIDQLLNDAEFFLEEEFRHQEELFDEEFSEN